MNGLVTNILGALGLISVAGGLFTMQEVQGQMRPTQLDPKTLCPIGQPPAAHFAVLVDRTDALTRAQAALLAASMEHLRTALPVHGELTLHLIGPDPATAAAPVLDLCNPGDAASTDPIWSNPRRAQKRFDKGFAAPLAAMTAKLVGTPAQAPDSPIIGALAAVAGTMTTTPGEKRIVLLSDLLENTSSYSVYRRAPDAKRAEAEPDFAPLSDGRLRNVQVEVLRLPSASSASLQTRALDAMWAKVLRDAGGVTIWDPVRK